jgi:RNA polymerase sigma-70 factor (ECF subfamily)
MRRVRDGDVAQLEILWQRHGQAVHRLCARLAPADADDLVQETFLRVLRYRTSWRGEGSIAGWLLRIARNACNDRRTHERREQAAVTAWQEPLTQTHPQTDARAELLATALDRLPADRREIIALARWHDLAADQIAEILGCSPGAVRVRLHRAMRELSEIMRTLELEAS